MSIRGRWMSPTTALTVVLPNMASARAESMPGWTARLDRDVAAGTVRSVTSTAAPNAGIEADQFAVPVLTLAPGPAAPPPSKSPDHTARLLSGAALVVAVLAFGVALIRRRHETSGGVAWFGVMLAIAMLTAPAASAQATRVATDPADHAVLTTGPDQVSATFDERLQTAFAAVSVVGPDGNLWSAGEPTVRGAAVVSIGLRPLGPAGTYPVNYRVTSADGHVVSGSRSFGLTVPDTGTPGPPATGCRLRRRLPGLAVRSGDSGPRRWRRPLGAAAPILTGRRGAAPRPGMMGPENPVG